MVVRTDIAQFPGRENRIDIHESPFNRINRQPADNR